MSELWTVPQAARYLCITTKRVYQLIWVGKIESCKLSQRTTRVTRQSVEKYVADLIEKEKRELGLDMETPAKVK